MKPAQERLDHRRIDFDDLVGDASVGFVMCLLKRILVGGLDQAKHVRTDLINPVGYEKRTPYLPWMAKSFSCAAAMTSRVASTVLWRSM